MALTPTGFQNTVFASLVEEFPGIASVVRSNPNRGVDAHNPVRELIGVLTQALIDAMSSVLIVGLQLGSAFTPPGAIVNPIPATLTSIGGWPIGGSSSMVSSLGWTGESALTWVRSLHEGVASYLSTSLQIQATPDAQPGVGVLHFTAVAQAYGVATRTAAASGLASNGKFFADDNPARGIRPELLDLAHALGDSVATLLESLSVDYTIVGTPTATPAVIAATGTFI